MKETARYGALGLSLALMLGCLCLQPDVRAIAVEAESEAAAFSAKGTIQAPETINLTAPMSGQAGDFAWKTGDWIAKGDLLLSIQPVVVRASASGTVRLLKAQVNDNASDVIARYGALCYVERDDVWHIKATNSGAYDEVRNRNLRVGQVVKVQHGSGSGKVLGEGTIISVADKSNFVVELDRGDFELEDEVKLYLEDSTSNDYKDRIGRGKIARASALGQVGSGVVASVLVSEGEEVRQNQPLFLLDTSPNADYSDSPLALPNLLAEMDGVIAGIQVIPGQSVLQGQLLMTLYPAEGLIALLEVDELDIAKVSEEQSIRVRIDGLEGERTGTVRKIRALGEVVLDTTKFLVEVEMEAGDGLRIGMHATGHWD